ncbi:hypothetical protein NEOLEDRAFT_1137048 [Neolentinus lepideus HHB14362 ss-1]|uniref:Uncharacterized protein n=1 Tax=Neolentinus lepideus HHB14362 ss-1 TaxID=1314782 RepID=A0A165R1C1_9AGAM|nr:hypothetical protein NEOLEDRAFT_1138007 [Neolentinus lepideus HHB14362 ss-1]KZT23170.1 hypothetical protein NEOLEDRAFT_1137048 [Neolentinus lepideus HHB14362 ss-1]
MDNSQLTKWGMRCGVIGSQASKILQEWPLDIQLMLEITAHLALHLVDLPQSERALAHDAP